MGVPEAMSNFLTTLFSNITGQLGLVNTQYVTYSTVLNTGTYTEEESPMAMYIAAGIALVAIVLLMKRKN